MGFIYDLFSGTQINNMLKPTFGMPLDPRCVVSDYSFFLEDDFINWLPYRGMIAITMADWHDNQNDKDYPRGAYWFDGSIWNPIGGTSNFEFNWPPKPSPYDPDLNYYLQFYEDSGDGSITPIWTPITQQSGFTFRANTPYIETNDGYIISNVIQSNERMELDNKYTFNDVLNTADVISVKDSDNSFHLMLNPDLFYVLYGGDSEGQHRVQLTVESPIIYGVNELNGGEIGIRWFMEYENEQHQHLWSTNPEGAQVNWYCVDPIAHPNDYIELAQAKAEADYEVPISEKSNYLLNSGDENDSGCTMYKFYNNLSEVGDTLTFFAIASKNNWLDSYIREITIEIVDDGVSIDVAIHNITRTTAELNM